MIDLKKSRQGKIEDFIKQHETGPEDRTLSALAFDIDCLPVCLQLVGMDLCTMGNVVVDMRPRVWPSTTLSITSPSRSITPITTV